MEESNAIAEELSSFAHAINNNQEPIVSISDGYNALEVAYQIIDKFVEEPDLKEKA